MDLVGVALSIAAILILLWFGLARPDSVKELWVAWAFWTVGFFGCIGLGLVKLDKMLNFTRLFMIIAGGGAIVALYAGANFAYGAATGQLNEFAFAEPLLSFSVGVTEELFFGIFLLGVLITWLGFHPMFAITVSALVHAFYHVPNWGVSPTLLLFFGCFMAARMVYVYAFSYVGTLLVAHGSWNFLLAKGFTVQNFDDFKSQILMGVRRVWGLLAR